MNLLINFVEGSQANCVRTTQWDRNVFVQFQGLDLPPTFEVHLGNDSMSEFSVVPGATYSGVPTVQLPNGLLQQARDIIGYLYLDTNTKYVFNVLISTRAKPAETTTDPTKPAYLDGLQELLDNINSAISQLNELINRTDILNALQSWNLKRKGPYLFEASYVTLPEDSGIDTVPGNCSSYVSNGKLYRQLDWGYSSVASFHIVCPSFEGMAFLSSLTDSSVDYETVGQLPYHIVDGVNKQGIMVATHVLYNDWNFQGNGEIPLTRLPYHVLTKVTSMETLEEELSSVLNNIYVTPGLVAQEYLIQVLVSDGTTTCVLSPNFDSGGYEVINITENPKLTNFIWIQSSHILREEWVSIPQDRPTGIERWNAMPCPLKDLRFTKAYEAPNRLSEFIGLRGTTRYSLDSELQAIYNDAHELYEDRTRDGQTWQSMHSAVYSPQGLIHLWVQEDYDKDYIASMPDMKEIPVTLLKGNDQVDTEILYGKRVDENE